MAPLPSDYLERVYAGVLGKLVGVYVGRPFEGWTHQRIVEELGPVHYYVHDKCSVPMVVTDDDISGTFTFIRALEEHGASADLSAEKIGKTWLNNVINRRTVFWWGGRGISTEHTAYVNLKKGIKAPDSGSIRTNGKTVAEQIGAQIFIDGWALVAPGNPDLAASFAEKAGSVSHDGESVYAAKVWAAMEAEAFVSKDIDHLLDVGLGYIPPDSLIATLIADVRKWSKEEEDWKKTRQRIEDKYGYDKFCGVCHVVPNHGIMVMALLYAGHDFHEAMHIINTSGWDTDCNSGNVGCLVAVINGLSAFEDGPDWLGPLADRALISSADGGYSINNAARIALDIARTGYQLAGQKPPEPPKDGAQFHFTLPGSVQGFQARRNDGDDNNTIAPYPVKVEQGTDDRGRLGLAIRVSGLINASDPVEVLTPTFAPPEVRSMRSYELVGSPLVYPGQAITAAVRADPRNTAPAEVRLALRAYAASDELERLSGGGDVASLAPGDEALLRWVVPASLGSRPVQALGVALSSNEQRQRLDGTVWLDYVRWDGAPALVLKPDEAAPQGDFWRRSFVDGADVFHTRGRFSVAQDHGEGIVGYGTRGWKTYRAVFDGVVINIGGPCGVAVRVQGLNRYYALWFMSDKTVALVKALDEERIEITKAEFDWQLDTPYTIVVEAIAQEISARVVGHAQLIAHDDSYEEGGIGLVAADGSIAVESIEVSPVT
ncbi:ADP-ribosylation/Crystallin J1 [Biscogniauxia mediterranea]|nr:ADP-ribosylation/Crystallin J1 [Biscogniauxia mediterranea]